MNDKRFKSLIFPIKTNIQGRRITIIPFTYHCYIDFRIVKLNKNIVLNPVLIQKLDFEQPHKFLFRELHTTMNKEYMELVGFMTTPHIAPYF